MSFHFEFDTDSQILVTGANIDFGVEGRIEAIVRFSTNPSNIVRYAIFGQVGGDSDLHWRDNPTFNWSVRITGATRDNIDNPPDDAVLDVEFDVELSWLGDGSTALKTGPGAAAAFANGSGVLDDLLIGNSSLDNYRGSIRDFKVFDDVAGGNLLHWWRIDDNSTTIVDSVVSGGVNGVLTVGSGAWVENNDIIATPTAEIEAQGFAVDGAAVLDGVATLAASAFVTKHASASLLGEGSVIASGGILILASAQLDGVATLSALSETAKEGTAQLDGVSTLTAVGSTTLAGVAQLDGVGSIVAHLSNAESPRASLDGVATLAAAGEVTIGGFAQLDGVATLAAVGSVLFGGAAQLDGVATLTAAGQLPGSIFGQATLSGVATLTAVAIVPAAGWIEQDEQDDIWIEQSEAA